MVEKPEQPTPRSEDMNLEEDLPGRDGFFASEYGEWATYDYVDPATGEVEDKQLLMVSHDRLMFASVTMWLPPCKSMVLLVQCSVFSSIASTFYRAGTRDGNGVIVGRLRMIGSPVKYRRRPSDHFELGN